jgi:hypothetical protein
MKLLTFRSTTRFMAIALFAGFALAAVSFGQDMGGYGSAPQTPVQAPDLPAQQSAPKPATPAPPPVNPKEQADYKALYDTPDSNADAKIKLGDTFLVNYPASNHKEAVYNQLLHAYYAKQDWDNFYSTGDKVLAVDPDDVDALAMIGWVIPHVFHSSDPDAQLKLAKAETYEKHVLDMMATMPKPANLTDAQFATTKGAALEQAHSGLGLVYFREQKAADSVTELQQATTNSASPDPTDLYVLGVELMALNRPAEAVDAFGKCTAAPSALQDQCKQRGDAAKKQAATAPH